MTVWRQTQLLPYMEALRIAGLFFLCCMPLLLSFRRRSEAVATVSFGHSRGP